jgi:hypothetical protein
VFVNVSQHFEYAPDRNICKGSVYNETGLSKQESCCPVNLNTFRKKLKDFKRQQDETGVRRKFIEVLCQLSKNKLF